MRIRKDETICEWIGVEPQKPNPKSLVGLSLKSLEKEGVINGLRHNEEGATNGWYIWKGELDTNDDKFFEPVCVEHIKEHLKINIEEYLELPCGYRFLIDDDNYEDVWFDEDLLILKDD